MKPLQLVAVALFACSSNAIAQGSTARDLIELENRFNEALVRGDIAVIEEIEANDLVFTDATGVVTSKSEEIQSIKSGEIKFASIKMADTRVQDYGNVGVVTGSLTEKAQYRNSDITGTYRFTDVWARRNGKWEHVAGQETLVSTPAEVPASAASDVAGVKTALTTLINLQPSFLSGIGHGSTFQISAAYSAIVRSLENFPEPATFKMALRAHSSESAYSAHSRSSASRYDFRSAKCM
jgi:ketosteroid isomerase-like protein